jgi:hypothetical protein
LERFAGCRLGGCQVRALGLPSGSVIAQHNKNPKPFAWTKTADEIRETLAACGQRIVASGC